MNAAVAEPTRIQAQSSQASPAAPRLHFVDGLRALAILMVLLFHCADYSDGWKVRGNWLGFVQYGHIGVNLFLVLSGFCLYWPFVRNGTRREPTLWEFAKRRCRRILPPYYAALALFWTFLLWDVLTGHHLHDDATSVGHVVKSLLWHVTMLYNLRPEYVLSINGPFWSLALEFSLYVLFPVLVVCFQRFGAARTVFGALALNLLYRCAASQYCPPDALTGGEQFVIYDSLFGRFFEFCAGMAAAQALARQLSATPPLPARRAAISSLEIGTLLSAAAAVLVTQRWGELSPLADISWGVCFGILILAAGAPGRGLHLVLSQEWMVKIGIFSYSVYLLHQPLVKMLDRVAMHHHWPPEIFAVLVIIPFVLLVGYGFHLVFEKPFLSAPKAKPTFRPVPAPASETVAAPSLEGK